MNKLLQYSAIAGICSGVISALTVMYTLFFFLRSFAPPLDLTQPPPIGPLVTTMGGLFISALLWMFFIYGYYVLGSLTQLPLLRKTALAVLLSSIFVPILHLALMQNLFMRAFLVFITGVITIAFGVAILRLKEFGSLAKATGIIEIITGISFVTVFLSFIGIFTVLIGWVLKIILLYKAAARY